MRIVSCWLLLLVALAWNAIDLSQTMSADCYGQSIETYEDRCTHYTILYRCTNELLSMCQHRSLKQCELGYGELGYWEWYSWSVFFKYSCSRSSVFGSDRTTPYRYSSCCCVVAATLPKKPKALSTLATIVIKNGDNLWPNSATVAVFSDSLRFGRQSPNSATVAVFGDNREFGDRRRFCRQSPFWVTVSEFGDYTATVQSPVWTGLKAPSFQIGSGRNVARLFFK